MSATFTRTINNDVSVEAKRAPLWWQNAGLMYTASGYGRKIPTDTMIKYNGRWRRVYCCIFSNSGTCYIVGPDKKWIVVN